MPVTVIIWGVDHNSGGKTTESRDRNASVESEVDTFTATVSKGGD